MADEGDSDHLLGREWSLVPKMITKISWVHFTPGPIRLRRRPFPEVIGEVRKAPEAVGSNPETLHAAMWLFQTCVRFLAVVLLSSLKDKYVSVQLGSSIEGCFVHFSTKFEEF